jgi:eukaryotic-like serine/threonine-protein kinase
MSTALHGKLVVRWLPPEIYEDETFCKKYEIERELGLGGAGVVVGARHRELDERVAIKFLLPGPQNDKTLARFRREARAASRVKSEHVVRVIDVSSTGAGVPYIVMEHLEGVDLERMLLQSPDGQLPIRDAIDFILQACVALAECHRVGIVHRDLKPSNLFCVEGSDGRSLIKVLDFGISKLVSATIDNALTGQHTMVGSPRYMSPEQFESSAEVDRRTDVWSLGVILYELATGEAPFVDDTLLKIWNKVKTGNAKPIGELRRDAPATLSPVVLKCLEKEPDQRYANVGELAKALLPFAPEESKAVVDRILRIVDATGNATLESSAPPQQRPEEPTVESIRSPTPARRKGFWGAALLAAVLAGALVLALSRRRPAVEPSSAPSAQSQQESVPDTRSESQPTVAAQPAVAGRLEPVETPRASSTKAASQALTARSRSADRDVAAMAAVRAPTAVHSASIEQPGNAPVKEASAPVKHETPEAASSAAPSAAGSSRTRSPFLVDIVEQRERRK